MVERLKKVEPDHMRIQRKEGAQDERRGSAQQEQSEGEEDKFDRKGDVSKLVGKEAAIAQRHPSFWEKRPTSLQTPQGEKEQTGKGEIDQEEVSLSTTITFLRAVGIINKMGSLRWGTVILYACAFVGFAVAVTFLINALL